MSKRVGGWRLTGLPLGKLPNDYGSLNWSDPHVLGLLPATCWLPTSSFEMKTQIALILLIIFFYW